MFSTNFKFSFATKAAMAVASYVAPFVVGSKEAGNFATINKLPFIHYLNIIIIMK